MMELWIKYMELIIGIILKFKHFYVRRWRKLFKYWFNDFFRFLELLDNIRYCKYNNISIYLKILFLSKFEKKIKLIQPTKFHNKN